MNSKNRRRPFTLWVVIAAQFILGFGSMDNGSRLFTAPDGSSMGVSVDLLAGSPFQDFRIPGILLFLVGVCLLLAAIALLVRPSWRWLQTINPCKKYHWSWAFSLAAGAVLLVWIITEAAMAGFFSPHQPAIGAMGIVIILLTLLPGVRSYYRSDT